MKDKKETIKQKLAAKSFYITAIAAFAVIIASVIISYYSTDRYDPKIEQPTDNSAFSYSQNAQAEKDDVPDERTTHEITSLTTMRETSYRPSSTTKGTTVATTEAKIVNTSFIFPSKGKITKNFSNEKQQYSKTMSDWRFHLGTDFEGKDGENVFSVGVGKVKKVLSDTKWGYVVEIDYGSFTARYCGLKQDGAVSINETVSPGSIIGQLGTIPVESLDGAHLHFEAIKDGKNIDPLSVLQGKASN